MFSKKIAVFYFAFITLLGAANAHINGKIFNIHNNEPIAGANILIKNTDIGTVSNRQGEFSIQYSAPFPVVLRITYIGYRDVEVAVNQANQPVEIKMEPVVLEGEEITVSGEPYLSKRDVQSKTETVALRRIEERGIRDVSEALQEMEAVNVVTSETGKQYISIRGSNFNEVSVYLDGIKLNRAADGMANLSVVDLSNLSEAEVIKGGTSILFGSGNFGGVVLLRSNQPGKSNLSFNRSFGLTDSNDQDLSTGINIKNRYVGCGGRYTGKSRLYDGQTLYTTIFSNLYCGGDWKKSALVYRHMAIDNSTRFLSGGVIAADEMSIDQLNFSGSLLKMSGWDIQVGTRNWHWEDDFFSNIDRAFTDRTQQARVSKSFDLGRFSTTLQFDNELQEYTGDQTIIDLMDSGTTYYDMAELEQNIAGYAAVVRYNIVDISESLEELHLELGARRSAIDYLHEQSIIDSTQREANTFNYSFEDDLALSTFRLGSFIKGRTEHISYTFFFNQGFNERAPTLADRQSWGTTYEQTNEYLIYLKGPGGVNFRPDILEAEIMEVEGILQSMENGLSCEYVTTTELNVNLASEEWLTHSFINGWEVGGGFFRNFYLDKVLYKTIQNDLIAPYNRSMAWLNGYELNCKLLMLNNRMKLTGNFTQIFPSDDDAFPNKPGAQFNILTNISLKWLSINLTHSYLGSQNFLRKAVSYTKLDPIHTTNFTLSASTSLWWFKIIGSYSVRNLFSNEVPELLPGQDSFEYYQVHRQLISISMELQKP